VKTRQHGWRVSRTFAATGWRRNAAVGHRSHNWIVSCGPAEASKRLSGEKQSEKIAPCQICCHPLGNVRTKWPVTGFHNLNVLSKLPEPSSRPSDEKARHSIDLVWPDSVSDALAASAGVDFRDFGTEWASGAGGEFPRSLRSCCSRPSCSCVSRRALGWVLRIASMCRASS
jgi:hypothetical protein